MANHVSALKRARQTEHKTDVNRANSSKLRSALRSAKESLVAGDPKAAQSAYQSCISILDKSVRKGTLHKNTAARYKSRLGIRLNKLAPAKSSK
jgi:small subunit ribosomal protein S20